MIKDNFIEFPYNGKPQRFKVASIVLDRQEQDHRSVFAIGQDTIVKVLPFTPSQEVIHKEIFDEAGAKDMDTSQSSLPKSTASGHYDQIGGLAAQIKTVREMVEIPLHNPQMFTQFGKRLVRNKRTTSVRK